MNTHIAASSGRALLENGARRRKDVLEGLKSDSAGLQKGQLLVTYTDKNGTPQQPFPRLHTVVFVVFVKEYWPLIT